MVTIRDGVGTCSGREIADDRRVDVPGEDTAGTATRLDGVAAHVLQYGNGWHRSWDNEPPVRALGATHQSR